MRPKKKPFGEFLVEKGVIDKLQLRAALSQQEHWGKPLGRTLIEMRLVSEERLIRLLGEYFGLPSIDLGGIQIDPKAAAFLDEAFCRQHECIPFAYHERGKFLDVAMSEVQDQELYDRIRVHTRCNIRPFLAGSDSIRDAIERAFGEKLSDIELQFKLSESLFDFGDEVQSRHIDPAVRQEYERGPTAQFQQIMVEPPEQSPTGPFPPINPLALAEDSIPNADVDIDQETRLQAIESLLSDTLSMLEKQEAMFQRLLAELRGLFGQLTDVHLIEVAPTSILYRSPPARLSTTPGVAAVTPTGIHPSALPQTAPSPPTLAGTPASRRHEAAPVQEQRAPLPSSPSDETRDAEARERAAAGLRIVEKRREPPPESSDEQRRWVNQAAVTSRRPTPLDSPPPSGEGAAHLVETPRQPTPSAVRPSVAPETDASESTLPLLELPAGAQCVVAMDLGTTRSSVATVVKGRVSVLKLPGGAWDIPSVVGFRQDNSVVLGKLAREMLATDPENAIASPKRLLGRRFDEPALGPYLAQLGMKVSAGQSGEIVLHARGRRLSVTEACGQLLKLLRLVAERSLGFPVQDVILTVPVSAGERQLRALNAAAGSAGLRVIEFLHEPVAAAMSCIFDPACRGLVAVYDFGGGTFDFSVVELGGDNMRVVACSGDSWLGGDDFDVALASAAANDFWQKTKVELRNQAHYWQQLLVGAEMAKCELSDRDRTVVRLPQPVSSSGRQLELCYPVNRKQFADLTRGIVERSLEACQEAMTTQGIAAQNLNAVYLSGGTSYVPAVQQAVASFFGQKPRIVIPPERMVVVGAAVHGALMPPSS